MSGKFDKKIYNYKVKRESRRKNYLPKNERTVLIFVEKFKILCYNSRQA